MLALIHALFPVDVEDPLGNGCHLVHLVGVEGDDPYAHKIGDVVDTLVLGSLEFQFAYQRLLGLYPMLYGSDVDALVAQGAAQLVEGILFQLFERRMQGAELL